MPVNTRHVARILWRLAVVAHGMLDQPDAAGLGMLDLQQRVEMADDRIRQHLLVPLGG